MKKEWGVSKDQYEKIIKKDEIALRSENCSLKNISVFDSENKRFYLKSLLTDKPMFILKYSSLQCSYCIEHSLDYLKRYEDQIGFENIILLVKYRDVREFNIFRQYSDVHPRAFNIYNDDFVLPTDSLWLPYIVITDSTLKTKEVFVPLKEFPKRTNKYFECIAAKYFDN